MTFGWPCSFYVKVKYGSCLNCVIKVVLMRSWRFVATRGRGHSLTIELLLLKCFKTAPQYNTEPIITLFLYRAARSEGKENLFILSRLHKPNWPLHQFMVNFKNFLWLMALKLGMQHWEIQNSIIKMTLCWSWTFLRHGQIWEMLRHKVSWKVLKVGLKPGIFRCRHEYMRECEYKKLMSLF